MRTPVVQPEAREADFAAVLLRPEAEPPVGLRASRREADGGDVATRLAVYRNTVTVGLVDALEARFPVTAQLLGSEFFRAAGRAFVQMSPPSSKVLLTYGDEFPAFLATFPQIASIPFVPDVAKLEASIGRAAHAADADPVTLSQLAALPQEALQNARLILHPSLEVLSSRFPIVSIHERESTGLEGPRLDMGQGEDALVLRPHLDVTIRRLPAGGRAFVEALSGGAVLSEAADAAARDDHFDLPANLAALFEAGAVVEIRTDDVRHHQRSGP